MIYINNNESPHTRCAKGVSPNRIYIECAKLKKAPTKIKNNLVNTHTQEMIFPPIMITVTKKLSVEISTIRMNLA